MLTGYPIKSCLKMDAIQVVREIELSTQQTQQKLEEFLESRQNNLNSVFLEKEHQTKRILEYFKLIKSSQVVVHDTQVEKSKKKAKKKKTKKRKKLISNNFLRLKLRLRKSVHRGVFSILKGIDFRF